MTAAQATPRTPIIDVHAHIYPAKIAEKAAASVGAFYGVKMAGNGSASQMLHLAAESPITHFVVHSVATKPSQVESINNFIAAECQAHPNFIGFATMHQDYEDPAAEINRACGLGLRGIKLHPDIQQVNMDDPRLMRVYEIAEERGLPLIIHTGDYRYDFSNPCRLASILRTFPRLVVDAAHLGGWSVFERALDCLGGMQCFVDASSSMSFLGPRRTAEIIRAYGTNRVLFGSDFPMWNPAEEFTLFSELGFSDAEYEQMLWHNAERFLGCDISL